MHHTKAFVTEETWVTRSKLVVGGIPSRKTRYVISLYKNKNNNTKLPLFMQRPDVSSPSDENMADSTLLGEDSVLVREQWVQILV